MNAELVGGPCDGDRRPIAVRRDLSIAEMIVVRRSIPVEGGAMMIEDGLYRCRIVPVIAEAGRLTEDIAVFYHWEGWGVDPGTLVGG